VSFNVIRSDRESWDPVWIFQGRVQVADPLGSGNDGRAKG
jgi:hypothetical protein